MWRAQDACKRKTGSAQKILAEKHLKETAGWRQYSPLKRRSTPRLHGATSQKAIYNLREWKRQFFSSKVSQHVSIHRGQTG
jgi:hypothetical protein